ncbi:MAG TPA: S41 family peptidase [Vicinamibacterales bacterium]
MNSRHRLLVLLVSTPLIVLAIVGGVLNRMASGAESYDYLKVFHEVVGLVLANYVEEVEPDRIMTGAMRGLAAGLDPDSAWLTAEQARMAKETGAPPKGSVGLELTRQYYLRVIAAQDGSPAARAGLTTGDYIRAIDGQSTRDMSVWEGQRLLRGAPGTKVELTVLRGASAEPHVVELTREPMPEDTVSGRIVKPGIGLVRVAAFTEHTAKALRQQAIALRKAGADHLVVDLRRTAAGSPDLGIPSARLFVAKGTLGIREARGQGRQTFAAESGDGMITLPVTILTDNGTSGAAEVFAAALVGNGRATLVGERTLGRAATQELVPLPDGSALWMSTARYLAPDATPIHAKGLTPEVEVEGVAVEFGAPSPENDPVLDKALELVASKKAA